MISVVIPLYNKALHIAKAIESVLQQTCQPLEIIVVDDGSTDGGKFVVEKYIDYGVSCVVQDNHGASAARNWGVELARGEYIAFLDADDWWLPTHIETLSKLIEICPKASLYSSAYFIQRGGKQYRPDSAYKNGWMGIVDNFFADYSIGLSLVSSITACVSRSDFLATGGFPIGIRRGEDIICWLNLALKGKVAHAETPTAVYFQDAVNRTNRLREVEAPGSLQYISSLLKSGLLTIKQQSGLLRLFDKIAFFTAAGFCMQGDVTGAAAIRKLAFATGRYKNGIAIGALLMIPKNIFYWAQHFRHSRVK